MVSVSGRRRPWVLAGLAWGLAAVCGCGNIYRPVVTSIPPVQPAPQPQKDVLVISCGNNTDTTSPTIYGVCANSTVAGLASLVDFSGDSLMARVNVGIGPRWLTLSSNGATAYLSNTSGVPNNAGGLNNFLTTNAPSAPLENSSVNTNPLLPNAQPTTVTISSNYAYVTQPGRSSIGVLNGVLTGTFGFSLEIPITDTANPGMMQHPVYVVGNYASQRVYAINQGGNVGGCPNSGPNGTAVAIENSSNTISAILPVGVCPIYGVQSSDGRRTFILNQGSGTITVIDSQQNRIDPNFPNGIQVGQGPVWADIYNNGSILAVVNSLSNTLTLINISTDLYGNDTPNFGTVLATVPVGQNPYSVSILQDGTRAYVANRYDPTNTTDSAQNGSVSVVSLTNYSVTKTIPLAQQPCIGNPTQSCNVHPISIAATTGTPLGKVYVVSPETNVMTVIRTDNDTIYSTVPLQGNNIQVRVTAP